jgi:lipopolysaccharide/colanic/teichoic acid biosynthesis glycosyltransferase
MQLRGEIDQYQQRQRVLPGITGWAQINHHYDASVDDVRQKLTYDLEYVQRQSLLHDALILLRTLPVVLLRRGAW